MLILTAEKIFELVRLPDLVASLKQVFSTDFCTPPRQVIDMPDKSGERKLLIMPAIGDDGCITVKLSTAYAANRGSEIPTIQGAIVVFSGQGTPIALLDGASVTLLRTSAASALASTYLSREESSCLAVVGTGALAPYMTAGHAAVRPVKDIRVAGRSRERAEATAAKIAALNAEWRVRVCDSIAQAVDGADIVSCCTSSPTPVLERRWLKDGAFVDLVGSYSPNKRESDDSLVACARLYVDTIEGALSEAGDIIDPLKRGIIARSAILGDLSDLVQGRAAGRTNSEQITLFKSVGSAIEDFAAAKLILQTMGDAGQAALVA